MDELAAGIASSRRAAAGVCEWALQPVEAAVDLRLSRLGVNHSLTCSTAQVHLEPAGCTPLGLLTSS